MSNIRHLVPPQAWEAYQHTLDAIILDVRDPLEFKMIGHPPEAINIPWKFAPDWKINPNFAEHIKHRIPDTEKTILVLCRSGQRSLEAAQILEQEGYKNLINISEGFEGPLNENKQRGYQGGWRYHQLPWEQN
ncbi:MAG: rhodanese-like domain-containing protein [Methylococcaceae bacterium]